MATCFQITIRICFSLIQYKQAAIFQSTIYKHLLKSFSAEKDMPLRNVHSKWEIHAHLGQIPL